MLRRALNFGVGIAFAASIAFPLVNNNRYRCYQWPWQDKEDTAILRNRLKNRLNILQYPANNPTEDAIQWVQLDNQSGYAMAVFDGHGGNQVSKYLKQNFLKILNQKMNEPFNDKSIVSDDESDKIKNKIIHCLKQTFRIVQDYVVTEEAKQGGAFTLKQGSTALVVVVSGNYLITANLGDSQAILIKQEVEKVSLDRLNRRMNVNTNYYYNGLKAFYDQKVIFSKVNQKNYITTPEGKTQLTGSIGDLFIKKFTAPFSKQYQTNKKTQKSNKVPSLVRSNPQITTRELTPEDTYLLLGTNGLHDEISQSQLIQISKPQNTASQYYLQMVLSKVVSNIANSMKQQPQFVRDIPIQMRPQIFDDISMILVNLENQVVLKEEILI